MEAAAHTRVSPRRRQWGWGHKQAPPACLEARHQQTDSMHPALALLALPCICSIQPGTTSQHIQPWKAGQPARKPKLEYDGRSTGSAAQQHWNALTGGGGGPQLAGAAAAGSDLGSSKNPLYMMHAEPTFKAQVWRTFRQLALTFLIISGGRPGLRQQQLQRVVMRLRE